MSEVPLQELRAQGDGKSCMYGMCGCIGSTYITYGGRVVRHGGSGGAPREQKLLKGHTPESYTTE